ncbi:MAG: hypothetical protein KAQ87_01630 [Candidatus Pacebacteria bacterium]|nr:hypothetical protein [Candidatus Paceibacterota bacterium]
MAKLKKQIAERLNKSCVCCGKKIKVFLYQDKSYRGGHFFGKILDDGKKEYWECPKCYWRK